MARLGAAHDQGSDRAALQRQPAEHPAHVALRRLAVALGDAPAERDVGFVRGTDLGDRRLGHGMGHHDLGAAGIGQRDGRGQGRLGPPRAIEGNHDPPDGLWPATGVARIPGRHDQHGAGRCLDDPPRRPANDATGLRAFAYGADDAKIHEAVDELSLQPIVKRPDCHFQHGIVDVVTPGCLDKTLDLVLRLPASQFPRKRILRRTRGR